MATAMFHRYADAPAIFPTKIPGVLDIRLEVSNGLATKGANGRGVIIERAFKKIIVGNGGIEGGLSKEIEYHFCLKDE